MKELYLSSLNLPSEAIAGGWGGAEILLINSIVWLFLDFLDARHTFELDGQENNSTISVNKISAQLT